MPQVNWQCLTLDGNGHRQVLVGGARTRALPGRRGFYPTSTGQHPTGPDSPAGSLRSAHRFACSARTSLDPPGPPPMATGRL